MKKKDPSIKRRKAAANRAEKRGKRAKQVKKEKHVRLAKKREEESSEKRKLDQHLERLMGKEAA